MVKPNSSIDLVGLPNSFNCTVHLIQLTTAEIFSCYLTAFSLVEVSEHLKDSTSDPSS